jgi:hypothetical protein
MLHPVVAHTAHDCVMYRWALGLALGGGTGLTGLTDGDSDPPSPPAGRHGYRTLMAHFSAGSRGGRMGPYYVVSSAVSCRAAVRRVAGRCCTGATRLLLGCCLAGGIEASCKPVNASSNALVNVRHPGTDKIPQASCSKKYYRKKLRQHATGHYNDPAPMVTPMCVKVSERTILAMNCRYS